MKKRISSSSNGSLQGSQLLAPAYQIISLEGQMFLIYYSRFYQISDLYSLHDDGYSIQSRTEFHFRTCDKSYTGHSWARVKLGLSYLSFMDFQLKTNYVIIRQYYLHIILYPFKLPILNSKHN